jgi:hypothetical protein
MIVIATLARMVVLTLATALAFLLIALAVG